MKLGSAWYPEHWDEDCWKKDIELMQAAGMNMVRVGEFAWSRLEPQEGQFDLDWLERAVNLAAMYGFVSVIGTPTAAPPAWMTRKYPETLAVTIEGRRAQHGGRCHFSFTNTRYRSFCHRIAGEMARRFADNPSVIGWQIDNEYSRVSYDDYSRECFQQWLRNKYGTLKDLNRRWTTSYWSEEYFDWSEIPMDRTGNPGLALDLRRWISAVYRDYQRTQIDAIRQFTSPRQWITSNFMGWFDGFDQYEVAEDLDLACWDCYVGTGHLDYRSMGAAHDLTRGLKRKNFYLMETQPGTVNWSPLNNALDRGEGRCTAWHAVGHGADAISYWQWRSALNGQEQYHGTLVAQDGNPRPFYQEVAQLGRDFGVAGPLLEGTSPMASIAILHSYDDRWAIDHQKHQRDFNPVDHLLSFYRPLRVAGYQVDIVSPAESLEKYDLIIAPHLHLLDEATADRLKDSVQKGAHLVIGPRSGFKDRDNSLLPSRPPGPLADLMGASVEEYYALEGPVTVAGEWGCGHAIIWGEWIVATDSDTQVVMSYGAEHSWLNGAAAAVTRAVDKGRATFLGAWLDVNTMKQFVVAVLNSTPGVAAIATVPEGVEVCERSGSGRRLVILINHTTLPQTMALENPMTDILTGRKSESTLTLPPRDVVVIDEQGSSYTPR